MEMSNELEVSAKVWVLYIRQIEKDDELSESEYCFMYGVYTTLEEAEITLAKGYIEQTENYGEEGFPFTYFIQEAPLYGTFQNPVRSIASDEPKSKNESR